MRRQLWLLLLWFPALASAKPLPSFQGVTELLCRFDLSSLDNKTVFQSVVLPVKASESVGGKGYEGKLGPFKVQVLFYGNYYGSGKGKLYIDKLTLTIWEGAKEDSPMGITGTGEGKEPIDYKTVVATRQMVKITADKKIVYYCLPPK